jgi:hypothetical protein
MARADTIGSNPFSLRAFEVVCSRHLAHFRQLPCDLDAEPENLETIGHHDGAVHTRQIGYQVGHLEQRFVHVAQMVRTTRFVGVPSNRRTVGSFITGELVHDVSHESHDPSAGLLIGEAVLHAHISPVLEQLGHTAVRHYNQCSPMLRGRPPAQTSTTFKRAPKAAGKVGKTSPLDFEKTDPDQPF